MKKKNGGFSLIELIAVIAILAIVSTGVLITVLSSDTKRAQKAMKQLDSALTETRVQSLSKTAAWLDLTYNASTKKYVLKTSYSSDIVLDGRFTITYRTSDGGVYDPKTRPMIISYERASGSLMKLLKNEPSSTGTFIDTGDSGLFEGGYCEKIEITSGSKTRTITLEKETGRHECVE